MGTKEKKRKMEGDEGMARRKKLSRNFVKKRINSNEKEISK